MVIAGNAGEIKPVLPCRCHTSHDELIDHEEVPHNHSSPWTHSSFLATRLFPYCDSRICNFRLLSVLPLSLGGWSLLLQKLLMKSICADASQEQSRTPWTVPTVHYPHSLSVALVVGSSHPTHSHGPEASTENFTGWKS
jgi:hypothetical protein